MVGNVQRVPTYSFFMVHLRQNQQLFLVILVLTCTLFLVYNTGYNPVNFSESMVQGGGFRPPAIVQQPLKPRIMITYYGRTGNHMFEYATLIGVARRNNMTPFIPSDLDLLSMFKLPTQKGSTNMLGMFFTYYEEKPAAYYNKTEKLRPYDAFLDGYYQSWKYFSSVRDELIRDHFVFHEHILEKALKFISEVRSVKKKPNAVLIGIHVRRGDFVRQKLKGYTAAPVPYFFRGMNYFRRKYKDVLFIICSNDVFWAEDNLDHGTDVFYSHLTDGAVDLAVLTRCTHMILTAGSYSWWAGYMVPGEVIYFEGFPEPNTKIGNLTVRADYYPPNWIPRK